MKLDFSKQRSLYQRGFETDQERQTHDELPEKIQNAEATHEASETIKAIPTKYKGVAFRSKLEAQWAMFFDACGTKWVYEAEGYELSNGMKYLPDFTLYDVHTSNGYVFPELYVEIKGRFREKTKDKERIWDFVYGPWAEEAKKREDTHRRTNMLILGNIPYGRDIYSLLYNAQDSNSLSGGDEPGNERRVRVFSTSLMFDFSSTIVPMLDENRKMLLVVGADAERVEGRETLELYKKIRNVGFAGKAAEKAKETAKLAEEISEVQAESKREMLMRLAKEHLSGYLVLEAVKYFVPADYLADRSNKKVLDGWHAVRMLKVGLNAFSDDSFSPSTAVIFASDKITKYKWQPVKAKLDFFKDLPEEVWEERIVINNYNRCVEAFERLIFSGFEASTPDRQKFWDKFLEEHLEGLV